MDTDYLFVYGLLMESFDNPFSLLLHSNSNLLGDGWTRGKLYDIGAYPGLVLAKGPGNEVKGKIYEITDPEILEQLDHFEGIGEKYVTPHEYIRRKVAVHTNNDELQCWAYIYNWSVDDYKKIESGDYRKYVESKR